MAKKQAIKQNKLAGKQKPSTQRYLDIAEITDDVVVLRDGTLRAVLLVSSINFALKSEDEQNATISAYVSFLNSFEFPIQIVIQSRRLNIDPYLDNLKQVEKEQTNELLRVQTAEYRQFVAELVELGQIMSKRFYVAVPYDPASDQAKGFFARLNEVFFPAPAITLKREKFIERKRELVRRVDLISAGLNSMGLSSVMLNTENLIELYYNTYNPVSAENQKLSEIKKITTEG